VKITSFNKRERDKRVKWVILGQKLTLNHTSLMDKEKEIRVLETVHKRERGNHILFCLLFCFSMSLLILFFPLI